MSFIARTMGILLVAFGALILLANVPLGILLILVGVPFLGLTTRANWSGASPERRGLPRNARVPPTPQTSIGLPLVGNVDPVCPHCSQALDRMPGRKKKCPHCGEFIFVRTRPGDRRKVLVTQVQAHEIEEQWHVVQGTESQDEESRRRYEAERRRLAKKFGREPGANDVRWGVLNKDLLAHAKNMDWGLYRNTRLKMAELLAGEQKDRDSLATYLEVCYLDLNGPNNCGGMKDTSLLREFPPWRPKDGFLAPGILTRVKRLSRKIALSEGQIRELFDARAAKAKRSLGVPLPPGRAWAKLERELSGAD